MAITSHRQFLLSTILFKYLLCYCNCRDKSSQLTDSAALYEIKKKMITNSILEKTGLDKSRKPDDVTKELPQGILQQFWIESQDNATFTRDVDGRSETKKIMLRAKKVTDFKCENCFRIYREDSAEQTSSIKAELWVHQDPSIVIKKKTFVKVYVVDVKTKKRSLLAKSRLKHKASGWYPIKLKDIMKYSTIRDGSLDINIVLQISCSRCTLSMSGINAPYFELSEKVVAHQQQQQTNKFATKCTKDSKSCCLDDFTIDFNDYAGPLSQMILLPKTVNVGICRGVCDATHAALDVHGSILRSSILKDKGSISEELCCVPKRYKPFSTLVYNDQGDIVVRNINDLIVDGCGCA